jgi:hypothetical protein
MPTDQYVAHGSVLYEAEEVDPVLKTLAFHHFL